MQHAVWLSSSLPGQVACILFNCQIFGPKQSMLDYLHALHALALVPQSRWLTHVHDLALLDLNACSLVGSLRSARSAWLLPLPL